MAKKTPLTDSSIETALQLENEKFREHYLWIKKSMPSLFFEELDQATIMLIVHNLMELELQDYFSSIQLKNSSIVICLDLPDADLLVLKNYASHGITSYQTYVSDSPPPFLKTDINLRIVVLQFYDVFNSLEVKPNSELLKRLRLYVMEKYPEISDNAFEDAMSNMSAHFIKSLSIENLAIAIKMHFRATTRDHCQYEVRYNEEWESKKLPSMRIIMAWRNTPKHNFLYRLVRTVYRHDLIVSKMSASHHNPYNSNSILLLVMDLHGKDNKPVWEVANMLDFVKDLITIKYFSSFDDIDSHLVKKGIISGNMANLLRAMMNFIHQALVHLDVNLYTLENIAEGLYRHPELTAQLCQAFKFRFDPDQNNEDSYIKLREAFLKKIEKLDTGHEDSDIRRRNILLQGMNFIHHTLKTNFYRPNYTSLGFRLDPKYLDQLPFNRTKQFPEMPYGIFFIKGMHFFGFHIRFKDLARGGLRTVAPEHEERMIVERNNVFTECYNLALTQQMKNKDIPEGGAKGIIFLKPYERLEAESSIYKSEMESSSIDPAEIEARLETFNNEEKSEHLYQAQRSFIESLVTLVNCHPDGSLRARDIIDYWNKPEYLYLGPDENMHDSMIEWIAAYSVKTHYKPGSSFISGKPELGINHKKYGVTSLGVNVYVDSILRDIGIDPSQDIFTVKMAGGPDGDVAGNEICNLQRYYPKTAKLVALTDISGTINDPQGLDLDLLVTLFQKRQSIRFYPPQKLSEGGFLIDKFTKRQINPLVQETVCWRNLDGKLVQDWLSGNDMHHLMRNNVHQTPADIFIPAGGRPRTLNGSNYKEFLDDTGRPTSRAIVEGANLYLDPSARRALEELGVLVIKDSSANKTGVICSSFEVLCGLTLGDSKFLENKTILVSEILKRLRECALNEATLLLKTKNETGEFLTEISDRISKRINLFTDQLLSYLVNTTLSNDPADPLVQCYLNYCLPTLREKYSKELMNEIPDSHKKAIISCHIASQLVYRRGLSWFPAVVDILPMLLFEQTQQQLINKFNIDDTTDMKTIA